MPRCARRARGEEPGTPSTSSLVTAACAAYEVGSREATSLHHVVEAMADLDPVIAEADWPGPPHPPRSRSAGSPALVVLLTALEPAAVEHSLLAGAPRPAPTGTGWWLASVRDRGFSGWPGPAAATPAAVYHAAAAEQVLQPTAAAPPTSRARWASDVVDADADRLPSR